MPSGVCNGFGRALARMGRVKGSAKGDARVSGPASRTAGQPVTDL